MDYKLKLRNKIPEYRRMLNMTQSELAREVGVSKNTISSIETYKFYPSAHLAALICAFFQVSFDDIFSLEW